MTRLSDYTTEELERLTTLTLETALPGECVASRPPELQRLDSLYGRVDTTPVLLLQLRPATDAETAAYHRAHCQPKVDTHIDLNVGMLLKRKSDGVVFIACDALEAGRDIEWFNLTSLADDTLWSDEMRPGISALTYDVLDSYTIQGTK